MDTPPPHQPLRKQVIRFPNGNRAQAVMCPVDTKVTDLAYALSLPKHSVLMMIAGGASHMAKHTSVFSPVFPDAITHIATSLNALIIDGGTQAGVMALIGLGVAQQPHKPTLLGVAPAGTVIYPGTPSNKINSQAVPLDPNHSHFVLVETDTWGGETKVMYELAQVFSQGIPSLALLVNGGAIAKSEVLYNVRQRRPIIIFEGSGRLADELADMMNRKATSPSEPEFSEIIAEGDLHLFPPTGTPADFEQLAQHLLGTQ